VAKLLAAAALILGILSSTAARPQTASVPHTITVSFNYNFKVTPACSAKVKANCVQVFNVYDISGGAAHRIKLFSVPVPAAASGAMSGISGTSPKLVFETGKHFLGVTAQAPSGIESDPGACQTFVQIDQ
jgi:hypothetical protein